MRRILVNAPSRLHLGFYNFVEGCRVYGGMGVALENPCVEVIVEAGDKLEVINEAGIPIDDVVENVTSKLDVRSARIIVKRAIPRHVGLGSTTQLSLAIGLGITVLHGIRKSIRELAFTLGRGYVSGVGIGVFEKGGFIIDSGRVVESDVLKPPKNVDELPVVIARYSLPRNWFFIVVVPEGPTGFREDEEKPLLEKPLKPQGIEQCKLYATLLLEMLPAIATRDAALFGRALTKIQQLTGQYFSRYQHGLFCCPESEEVAKIIAELGALGVGQSSWGPSVYGLADSKTKALRIARGVVERAGEIGIRVKYVFVSKPRNRGYVLKYI